MDPAYTRYIFDSSELASRLIKGSAALFPTDTLPALASLPESASQLWKIKSRPLQKPLILMGASSTELFGSASNESLVDAEALASKYWPGSLTMILPASGPIVQALNPGGINIGMRVPDCDAAIELLAKSGPLATTSANLAGDLPATDAMEASHYFPNLPLLGPIPWTLGSGKASTVVLWKSKGWWQVLRRGAVILPEFQDI